MHDRQDVLPCQNAIEIENAVLHFTHRLRSPLFHFPIHFVVRRRSYLLVFIHTRRAGSKLKIRTHERTSYTCWKLQNRTYGTIRIRTERTHTVHLTPSSPHRCLRCIEMKQNEIKLNFYRAPFRSTDDDGARRFRCLTSTALLCTSRWRTYTSSARK